MRCSPPYLYCQNAFHIYVCALAAVIFLVPVPHVLSSEFVQESVVKKPPPRLEGRGRASEVFDLLSIATDIISEFTAITRVLIQPWPRWYVLAC